MDRFLRPKLLIFTLCTNARRFSSLFRFGRANTRTHTWNARLDSRWQKDNSHGERLVAISSEYSRGALGRFVFRDRYTHTHAYTL